MNERSPLLKEMDGLLAHAIQYGACEQCIDLLKQAILHQQMTEDIARMLADEGPGGQGPATTKQQDKP